MDVLNARLCLMLHSLPQLPDRPLRRLFHHYGTAREIWDSNIDDWLALGISPEASDSARGLQASASQSAGDSSVERQLTCLRTLEADVVSLTDPRYPALLNTLYDPPPILYALGDVELLQQAQLGVVGSRKASPPGKRATRKLCGELVRTGLHICSGLAIGIDQAAHRAALDSGGKTVAVMATGLDVIYPSRHRSLAQEISQSGILVSEFPPGAAPLRQSFPKRNRIISGLSLGVLVVEAALRSGSLITARTAMEQGREVFALPWSMFHPGGDGCLNLIRDGVKMVQSVDDILEELGPLYECQRGLSKVKDSIEKESPASFSATEAEVLTLIGSDVITVDEIVDHSGIPVASVLAALSCLEVARRIVRSAGGYIQC